MIIISGMIALAVLMLIVGVITGKILKKKILERLGIKGVDGEITISAGGLKEYIEQAHPKTFTKDDLDALSKMDDDDIIMIDKKKDGSYGDIHRIHSNDGMSDSLRDIYRQNDGIMVFEE